MNGMMGGYGKEKSLDHQCSLVESFGKKDIDWMKSRVLDSERNVSSHLNCWNFDDPLVVVAPFIPIIYY